VTLMLYVIIFGGAVGATGGSADDALFFLRSFGVYGLAFSGLMAASAINNERRSRRILAVLSKGIERRQYLAGLLGGVMLGAVLYCVVIGVVATAVLTRQGLRAAAVWGLVVMLLALFALAAATAMMFSTFLHPLLATAAAAVLLAAAGALGKALGGLWFALLPAYELLDAAVNFGAAGWRVPWFECACAAGEAAVLWGIACLIFARRDIAVAVE
jgi:ABC-type transport system involved in multi-copper enzyme maturation permease subunit